MFGYVRPRISELKVRELEDYKAVYCGLCRVMGKRHGFLARFTLNYDFVFLAMVLAFGDSPCQISRCRCPAHPFRKRKMCHGMSTLEVAADESMILSYHKLRDDILDNTFLRSLPVRIACIFLKPAYKKAAKARPEFDRDVSKWLDVLHDAEQERVASIDRPADAFAKVLQAAAPKTGDNEVDRALEQMLYHVGRWIYLVDAWDDLDEDIMSGSYNPIHERYHGDEREFIHDMRTTLSHSRNLATGAYELAKAKRWDSILSNILYLGLPAVEELVFAGCWQNKRNRLGD